MDFEKNGGLSVASSASLIYLHRERAQTDKISEGARDPMYV
jgi:hypothetical protein